MLDFVRGEVVRVAGEAAVISVGGVGVRVQMPTGDLAGLRGNVTVHTVLQVKDEDVHLYGFVNEHGRELFGALTSVQGVGPKVALAILSYHRPEALVRAIATGDSDALTAVSGVGKKTAQRIVLELKEKIGVVGDVVPFPTGAISEVRDALKGLGYGSAEIQQAVTGLPTDGDAPTLLRYALRALGTKEPVG